MFRCLARATLFAVIATSTISRSTFAQEMSLRIYDIRSFQRAFSGQEMISIALPLRASCTGSAGDRYVREALGEPLEPEFDGSRVIDLLSASFQDDDVEKIVREVSYERGYFALSATDGMHDLFKGMLAHLESALLGTAIVEIHAMPSASASGGQAIFTRTQTRALLATFEPRSTTTSVVTFGQRARVTAARRTMLLRDFDVEVAQKSKIADPLVSALFEGLEADVEIRRTATGHLFATFRGRHAARVGAVTSTFTDRSVGQLQLVRTKSSVVTSAATFESGGGFLVGSDANDEGVWFVRVTSDADVVPSAGPLTIVSGGSAMAAAVTARAPMVVGPLASGSRGRRAEEIDHEDSEPFMSNEHVIDRLRQSMKGEVNVESVGQRFAVRGKQVADNLTTMLRDFERGFAGNLTFEIRYGTVADEVATELRGRSVDELIERLPHAAVGVGRRGDDVLIVSGEEALFVKDFDVEIAQEAVIADPIPETVFSGLSMSLRGSVLSKGKIRIDGDATLQHLVDIRAFDGSSPSVGPVQLPEAVHTRAKIRATIENGKWMLLRSAPFPGTGRTAYICARVTTE